MIATSAPCRLPPPQAPFVHLMQGMPGKRLETILQMLEQNPTDSFLLYGLANEYKNEGDLDKAVASYRHGWEVNPE